METTISLKVRSQEALDLLKEMESNSLIEFVNSFEFEQTIMEKKSSKFKGIFSNEDTLSFDNHSKEMREEWQNIGLIII